MIKSTTSEGYIYGFTSLVTLRQHMTATITAGIISVKATYLLSLASATLNGVLRVEIRSWHKHRFEMSEASWKYIV